MCNRKNIKRERERDRVNSASANIFTKYSLTKEYMKEF